MKDQWPLVITEAEVLEAEMQLDFEFFANLIRYKQPIEASARERAADTILRYMRGNVTRGQKRKLQTLAHHRRIAARVKELKEAHGSVEAAVKDAAKEFGTPRKPLSDRAVYTAWSEYLEHGRFAEELSGTLIRMRDAGAGPEDLAEAWAKGISTYVKDANRRLKRKG